MEGTARLPGSRAAEYQDEHPGAVICCVEGTWRAWLPADGDGGGDEYWGRDEAELTAKLP